MRIRVFIGIAMLAANAAAAAPAAAPTAPLQKRLYRLVRPEIVLDFRNHQFSLLPLTVGMDSTIMVRHIRETFGTKDSSAVQKVLQSWDDVPAGEPKSAFSLASPPRLTPKQKAALESDLTELTAILLQQEKAHRFHQTSPMRRAAVVPRVVVDDTDDPTTVRAKCGDSTIHVSTGFLRRLLESAIASVNSGVFFHERPDRDDKAFGDWPPVVPALYSYQRKRYGGLSMTIGPTTQRLIDQLMTLERDVYPAAKIALAKTGFHGDLHEYGQQFTPEDAPTYAPELVAVQKLPLEGAAAKRRAEILENIAAIEKSFENDPKAEAENKLMGREMDIFAPAAEEMTELMTYTLWVEQEYLKALMFVLGHEASHLWINDCREDVEDENLSDAFGVLVAFELFRNHHYEMKVEQSKALRLALGHDAVPSPAQAPETDPLNWMLDAEGRSGVQLMVSVYRDIMSVNPQKHASFAERQDAVERIYTELVKSTIVIQRN